MTLVQGNSSTGVGYVHKEITHQPQSTYKTPPLPPQNEGPFIPELWKQPPNFPSYPFPNLQKSIPRHGNYICPDITKNVLLSHETSAIFVCFGKGGKNIKPTLAKYS